MKNNFRSKFITNIVYSLIITLAAEFVLVSSISRILPGPSAQKTGNFSFMTSNTLMVLLFVFFGIALFVLLFWIFQKKSFDYLNEITDAVRKISDGDLNVNLEIREDDEFSEIAMNLNSMTGDIKELMERERESERTKNELITNIAHDLRTPLTSIIGYLELLSEKKDLPEDTKQQYINIAYTKTRKLEKLIEDLFGFTKLTYGKIAMKVEKIDIVKLLSQLMDEFYPSFTSRSLDYELTSNVPAAVINADGTLIARLFDNLINNAIKYGAEGKRIDVKILAEPENTNPETVTVSVINYGKVIPQNEIPHLFDKFYRVESSRNSGTGGTGLGLAIAKSIVDMHNGTIHVESDLNGTRFTVSLQVNFDAGRENF